MLFTHGVFLAAFILTIVTAEALSGRERNNAGRYLNPLGSKPVQASVQARRAILFGCKGLDLVDANITCTHERLETRYGLGIDCAEKVPLRTRAEFLNCPPGHQQVEEYTTITCKFPGKWDNELFTCEETPTEEPTTTTKNSTLTTKTTAKPTIKKPANVTTNSTAKAANTTAKPTTLAGNSTTNTTSTIAATTTTTVDATNTTTTTTPGVTTTPAAPGYQTVVDVGVVRKGMKCLTFPEAVAECSRDGAVVMTVDSPAKAAYVQNYMNTSSIFVGAINKYDFWVGLTVGPDGWKTARGVPVSNIPFVKWFMGRPVNGTSCAVWATHKLGFWDISTDDCARNKLAYICVKP